MPALSMGTASPVITSIDYFYCFSTLNGQEADCMTGKVAN